MLFLCFSELALDMNVKIPRGRIQSGEAVAEESGAASHLRFATGLGALNWISEVYASTLL